MPRSALQVASPRFWRYGVSTSCNKMSPYHLLMWRHFLTVRSPEKVSHHRKPSVRQSLTQPVQPELASTQQSRLSSREALSSNLLGLKLPGEHIFPHERSNCTEITMGTICAIALLTPARMHRDKGQNPSASWGRSMQRCGRHPETGFASKDLRSTLRPSAGGRQHNRDERALEDGNGYPFSPQIIAPDSLGERTWTNL